MNPKEVRAKRRYLHNENRRYKSGVFIEIPQSEWPTSLQAIPLLKVFRSRELLVQVFAGEITRLSISTTELNFDGHWKDSITWDQLQDAKNKCGYADCDAVEAYPKALDVVNVANIRHLWIVPPSYTDFFWRSKKGSGFKSGDTAEQILETHL